MWILQNCIKSIGNLAGKAKAVLRWMEKDPFQDWEAQEDDPDIEALKHPERYKQKLLEEERKWLEHDMDIIQGTRRDKYAAAYRKVCFLRERGILNDVCTTPLSGTKYFAREIDAPGYFRSNCISMTVINRDSQILCYGPMKVLYYIVFDITGKGRLFFLAPDEETEVSLDEIADTPIKAKFLRKKLRTFDVGVSCLETDADFMIGQCVKQLRKESYDE